METREQMIERHKRELEGLEAKWWEPWFTEDPYESFRQSRGMNLIWMQNRLPSIIRKREKFGLAVGRQDLSMGGSSYIFYQGRAFSIIEASIAERLACRPIAPGERVEI